MPEDWWWDAAANVVGTVVGGLALAVIAAILLYVASEYTEEEARRLWTFTWRSMIASGVAFALIFLVISTFGHADNTPQVIEGLLLPLSLLIWVGPASLALALVLTLVKYLAQAWRDSSARRVQNPRDQD